MSWTRLLPHLRRRRPCGARGPAKLPDCGRCVAVRGHQTWHADGNGYLWNDDLGRWQWVGEPIDLAAEYRNQPYGDYRPVFTEDL